MISKVERILNLYQQLNEVQFSTQASANNVKIARYVNNHLQEVIFMTSSKIAKNVGVSQPAVIRFAKLLNYNSFSELLKDLQELPNVFSEQQDSQFDKAAQSIIDREYESLKNLSKYYSESSTTAVAQQLYTARTIHIFGTRTAVTIANYFYFYFRKIHAEVYLHTNVNMELYERLLTIDKENTMVMLFAYPRYSKDVVDLLQFIKHHEISYITFADSYALRTSKICDVHLVAPVTYTDTYDSLSAAFCLLNILLDKITSNNLEQFKHRKANNENLYKELGFFISE
ncbi:DNA-binding MurR/RpiR family transcriptional regulator [Lysinibacillus sp. RC46]|uniref:MurR/RpiR family transcriptional regulator n=1 Tax=unclassified Lysinibacillus TaxID=2636778 RepID=UPI003514C530